MIEDQNDILDSRIKLHDKHRFEIKLDIDLDASGKSSYEVETYFFVPRALNIGPHNYGKEKFYNSSQRYIRFRTPKISLGKLCAPSLETSPLNRIKQDLGKALSGAGEQDLADTICDEFRLLGCIIRGEIRDYVKVFVEGLATYDTSVPAAQRKLFVAEGLETFLADLKNLETALASVKANISDPAVPVKVKETAAFFDEYVSLILEEYLTALIEALRRSPAVRERFADVEAGVLAIVTAQNRYRQAMKYPSVLVPGSSNEVIIYRRGVLKKFISSVLYLKAEFSEWEGLTQVFFGLAAGGAMLFAVLVTLFFQSHFAMNSMPFVFAVVVSYIFKDRIKDWLKLLFSKNLTRWISDRKIDILDSSGGGKRIGLLKEAVTFISDRDIPPDIDRLRRLDNITSVDEEGKPERVFKYKKEILLYPDVIIKSHDRLRDLNDIMRFNIRELVGQADDSSVDYPYVDPVTGELRVAACARVYHLNMVIKYTYFDKDKKVNIHYERIRIVLNKDGIVRLEEVKLA
ncbi:MAG: hypothetical protein COX65_00630 [Elusimicrobia bacterium CG_4_10_14_0_2_um_filter_56_8]|nr:MAG: hypothetical protein AUJ51_01770 [Elusimicrobia bacterium CG1_02_56_21]PJA17669.1 MAG: hypothetical protein COX65_00630 [Elusimicrobia bacterium CG_4_10_14_0_2_um_filter_56_8]